MESSNRRAARAHGEHSSAEELVGVVWVREGPQCERPLQKQSLVLQKLSREDILELTNTLALPERTPTAGRGRGQGCSHVREGRLRRQRGRGATPREKLTLAATWAKRSANTESNGALRQQQQASGGRGLVRGLCPTHCRRLELRNLKSESLPQGERLGYGNE